MLQVDFVRGTSKRGTVGVAVVAEEDAGCLVWLLCKRMHVVLQK